MSLKIIQRRISRRLAVVAAGVSLGVSAQWVDAAEVRIASVLKTGDAAPALFGAGVTWSNFLTGLTEPTIDDNGLMAFVGVLAGPNITPDRSTVLMVAQTGQSSISQFRLIARAGDQSPQAAPGVVFTSFLPLLLGDGRVAFVASLAGPGVTTANDNAAYVEVPGGGLALLLREGDPAPGIPGATVATNGVGLPYFAPNGTWAATVTLTGTGVSASNDTALYRGTTLPSTSATLIAREGEAIPGQASLLYGGFGSVAITNNGFTFARLSLVGSGTTVAPSADEAILRFDAFSNTPVVFIREGNSIPGGMPGSVWGRLISCFVTRGEQLGLFAQELNGTASILTPWVGPTSGGGLLRPATSRGTAAPGFPTGANLLNVIIDHWDCDTNGAAAFIASTSGGGVTTSDDSGAFYQRTGGLTFAAREGALAPGLTSPFAFGSLAGFTTSCAMSDLNQAAFWLYAPSPAAADVNDTGLWVMGASGGLTLVAHKRTPFALAPGDIRTISLPGYRLIPGPQWATRQWLNRTGRMVFTLGFADQTNALIIADIDPATPLCRADFNMVGGVTVQDVFDFLVAWFDNRPGADFNGAGGITVQDVFDFLTAWFLGC